MNPSYPQRPHVSSKKNQHTPSYIEITYCKPGEPWRRKVVSSRRLESVVL